MVILYVYPCIGPDKSLFWQHKYKKDGCEGKKPLHRWKTVFGVFVYWCIGAKKSQPKWLQIASTNTLSTYLS